MGDSERRFPGGLLLLDVEGRILEAPLFFRDALEFDLNDESTIFDLFSIKRRPRLTINRVVASAGGEREYHVTIQREDGDPLGFRYWDVTSDASTAIAFYVVDDTSVVKSHEWRMKRLRRSLLNDAADFIANDLSTQIGTLSALAEVLKDSPDDAAEAATRLVDAISTLSSSVTEFSKSFEIEDEEDESFPMLLKDVSRVISSWSDKMVKVECDVEGDNDTVVSSSVVERIISPLVTNAIESRPSDGTVRVAIKPIGERVSFEISDKGRGMTKHELSRAEDPFFSTKRGHSGLGLPTARAALKSVGGYWNYTSSRRKGTRVRVVVPAG